jgi:hypothetical protein
MNKMHSSRVVGSISRNHGGAESKSFRICQKLSKSLELFYLFLITLMTC